MTAAPPAPHSPTATPTAHVVLYHPEIPQNTGNIGRSCVAVGAKLWIVRPAGFDFSNARVRRAGLDYWQHLDLQAVDQWSELLEQLPGQQLPGQQLPGQQLPGQQSPGQQSPGQQVPDRRMFFFTRFATRELWDAEFRVGDCFVFGSESSGLPREIVGPNHPNALRLPTTPHVRSLNLATTAGIVLYEQQRQLRSAASVSPRASAPPPAQETSG